MADLGPNKKRIAQLFRVLGTSNDGERKNAWRFLVCAMQNDGVSWNDIGDVIAGAPLSTTTASIPKPKCKNSPRSPAQKVLRQE